MRVILSICGYGSVVIGVINLLFMGPIWGICKYSYVECSPLSPFDSYANADFVFTMGVGGFFSLVLTGILFLGFSKVIELLEEIRDSNKKD